MAHLHYSLFRHLVVITSCHTDSVAAECGSEAAKFVDNFWTFQFTYCYPDNTGTTLTTKRGTTTELPASVTQDITTKPTGQDIFTESNGTVSVRKTIDVVLLFLSVALKMAFAAY